MAALPMPQPQNNRRQGDCLKLHRNRNFGEASNFLSMSPAFTNKAISGGEAHGLYRHGLYTKAYYALKAELKLAMGGA